MQMCPFCDHVYDESEYSHCPYCSGELNEDDDDDDFDLDDAVLPMIIGPSGSGKTTLGKVVAEKLGYAIT